MDRELVEAFSDSPGFPSTSGSRTILFLYYPPHHHCDHHGHGHLDVEEEPPTSSPLKWRHFRILKDLFGRDIFEKGTGL